MARADAWVRTKACRRQAQTGIPIPRPHQSKITTIARARTRRIAERGEDDRAVVLEEFEQDVERARLAGQSERDVELVQGLAVVAQRAQSPGEVRARHDFVVLRAARLQYLEALAYRTHRRSAWPRMISSRSILPATYHAANS